VAPFSHIESASPAEILPLAAEALTSAKQGLAELDQLRLPPPGGRAAWADGVTGPLVVHSSHLYAAGVKSPSKTAERPEAVALLREAWKLLKDAPYQMTPYQLQSHATRIAGYLIPLVAKMTKQETECRTRGLPWEERDCRRLAAWTPDFLAALERDAKRTPDSPLFVDKDAYQGLRTGALRIYPKLAAYLPPCGSGEETDCARRFAGATLVAEGLDSEARRECDALNRVHWTREAYFNALSAVTGEEHPSPRGIIADLDICTRANGVLGRNSKATFTGYLPKVDKRRLRIVGRLDRG